MQVALVERAQGGDQEAFAALATASVDRCYAIAYRILRDMHRAQDATQQALLSAWRDLPTLRDPERFDAWLHRLVVRACYAEAARDRRWGTGVRLIPSDRSTVPDSASSIADRDELERGFRGLSPEQRAVVVLHHHLGYPLTEIAATLGISITTVNKHVQRVLKKLNVRNRAQAAASQSDASA